MTWAALESARDLIRVSLYMSLCAVQVLAVTDIVPQTPVVTAERSPVHS